MKTKFTLVLLMALSGVTFAQTLLFKYKTDIPTTVKLTDVDFNDPRGTRTPDLAANFSFNSFPFSLTTIGSSYLAIFVQGMFNDPASGLLWPKSGLYIFDLKGALIQKIEGSREESPTGVGVDKAAEVIVSPSLNFIYRGLDMWDERITRLYIFNRKTKSWSLSSWTPPEAIEFWNNSGELTSHASASGWGVQQSSAAAYWLAPSNDGGFLAFSVYRF